MGKEQCFMKSLPQTKPPPMSNVTSVYAASEIFAQTERTKTETDDREKKP